MESNFSHRSYVLESYLKKLDHVDPKPSENKFWDVKIPTYLMSFPTYVDASVPNNVYMKKGQEYDYQKAYSQFHNLLTTVVGCGGLPYLLPPNPGLQDQVYTANLGLALPPSVKKNMVILSNFRSTPRTAEESPGRDFFSAMKFDTVQCPYYFEGEADLKYVRDNIFVGGYGLRSDEKAHRWMEKEFGVRIISVKMTNEKAYHFDCNFFTFGGDKAIMSTDLFSKEEVREVSKVVDIIHMDKDVAFSDTTNVVRIGKHVLCHDHTISLFKKGTDDYDKEKMKVDFLSEAFTKHGLEPIFVNLSEFYKSGAALSCMMMRLNYENNV